MTQQKQDDMYHNISVLCNLKPWQKLYHENKIKLYTNDMYYMQSVYRTITSVFNDSTSINIIMDLIEHTVENIKNNSINLMKDLSDVYVSKNKSVYNTIADINKSKKFQAR